LVFLVATVASMGTPKFWVSIFVFKIHLYPPASQVPWKVPPHHWRHAQLDEIKHFLLEEKKRGRFVPIFSGGL